VCSSQSDGAWPTYAACRCLSQAEATYADGTMLMIGSRGGLRVLEWTGSLVPQGALVKGAPRSLRTAFACSHRSVSASPRLCACRRREGRVAAAVADVHAGVGAAVGGR